MSDLVTNLKAAKYASDTAYVIFLELCYAFNFVPHDMILSLLQAHKVVERICTFIAAFLRE